MELANQTPKDTKYELIVSKDNEAQAELNYQKLESRYERLMEELHNYRNARNDGTVRSQAEDLDSSASS